MMNNIPKIVRGNDFDLVIRVQEKTVDESGNTNYVPFDFTGTNVLIKIVGSYQRYTFPIDVSGDTLTIHVNGKKISNGTYGVEILVEKDGNRRSFKRCQFGIVESDNEADITSSPDLGVQTVELDTQVIVGYGGGTVDLSDYYTKEEVGELLKNKIDDVKVDKDYRVSFLSGKTEIASIDLLDTGLLGEIKYEVLGPVFKNGRFRMQGIYRGNDIWKF